MPRGKIDWSLPGAEPEVTTDPPTFTGWFFPMYWSCMSFGSPTAGLHDAERAVRLDLGRDRCSSRR